jgi:hypothetical protein
VAIAIQIHTASFGDPCPKEAVKVLRLINGTSATIPEVDCRESENKAFDIRQILVSPHGV